MKKNNQDELDELFIQGIIAGKDKVDVYNEVYAQTSKSPTSQYVMALKKYKMFKPEIMRRRKEATLRLQEKQLWTREKATEVLSQIIEINSKEQTDVLRAYDFDIAELENQLDVVDEDDTISQKAIIDKINAIKKKKKMNKITNDAIVNASSELNKIHGLNEQTIKLDGSVQFVDVELED